MKMGGGAKPFGIDAERVPALAREVIAAGAEWRGLHIFAGSQALDAEAIAETQAQRARSRRPADATRSARRCRTSTWAAASAFPISPATGRSTSPRSAQRLAERFADLPEVLADTEFCIELGRYLVGEAGVYLTRIVDRKESHGEVFLVTDGGLHHQLAASGNFGTVVRRNYPVAIATPLRRRARGGSQRRRLPVHAARPARRQGAACRAPRSAIWSRCSAPGPMAPAPARRTFLGQGPAREMLV